jgi:hypothetical protein
MKNAYNILARQPEEAHSENVGKSEKIIRILEKSGLGLCTGVMRLRTGADGKLL